MQYGKPNAVPAISCGVSTKRERMVHWFLRIGAAVLSFLALTSTGAFAQATQADLDWAVGYGGSTDDEGFSVAADGEGNVISVGYFTYTVDFDPGPGVYNLTSPNSHAIFINKVDSNGELVWAHAITGSEGMGYALEVAVDGAGNVYAAGLMSGVLDFDPGVGEALLVGQGPRDAFVCKFNAAGGFVWARRIGSTGFDSAYALAVDADGGAYVSGAFDGTVDFDPSNATLNISSAGASDIFLCKLNVDGSTAWAKGIGGTFSDAALDLALAPDGAIAITGAFVDTVDFDPGAGISELSSVGSRDIFVCQYEANGDFLWAKQFGEAHADQGNAVAVDSSGNVFAAGNIERPAPSKPNPGIEDQDHVLLKLSSSGDLAWSKVYGGPDYDDSRALAVDAQGYVYVGGLARETLGASSPSNSAVYHFMYTGKFDTHGNQLWKQRVQGDSYDSVHDVAVDSLGSLYQTGVYVDEIDFDTGTGTALLPWNGDGNIFVTKTQVPPQVALIRRTQPNPTPSSSVQFDVLYTEHVTGVDVGDFAVVSSGDIAGASVVEVSGSGGVYSVTVNTGTGNGQIRLDLLNDDSIVSVLSESVLVAGDFTTGESYDVERVDWADDLLEAFTAGWGAQGEVGYLEASMFFPEIAEPDFNALDANGDGFLQVTELRQASDGESAVHASDYDGNGAVDLEELLRAVQLYNASGYHCAVHAGATEDGYESGAGEHHACLPHTADYIPMDWAFSLSELLRLVQVYNSGGYEPCPAGEDEFCAVAR